MRFLMRAGDGAGWPVAHRRRPPVDTGSSARAAVSRDPVRAGGSALMLMPAAVLVVVILGAISVDSAVVFMAQRDLVNGAQAAANDAVAYGLDESAFRAGRGYAYDPARVEAAVSRALLARGIHARHRWYRTGDRLVVELDTSVDHIFSQAVPGGRRAEEVHARADARLLDRP